MIKRIVPLTILSTILSSCMTQPSAPIDYNLGASSSSRGSLSSGSNDIVEKPIIHEKTNWGDNQVHEETHNVTPNYISTELDKPKPPLETPPLRTEIITHEVIEGETIDSIAKQYDIERDALIKANKLKDPYTLEELQILKIPPQVSPDADITVGNTITPNVEATSTEHFAQSLTPTLPIKGNIISKFGDMNNGIKNNGINIQAPLGSEIRSLSAGSVVFSGNDPKFGNLIIVKSENADIFMAYSHMNDLIPKKGDIISNGQTIGHIGQTGNVTSPQLHFAVRQGKIPVDPVQYLSEH